MLVRLCCVDGTNVVRGCFGYAGPAFEEQELSDNRYLSEALARLCEGLAGRVEVELFFDGPCRAPLASSARAANFRIRFAEGLKADDVILDRVRAGRYLGQGRVCVVTADSELGRRVLEEGGRWARFFPGDPVERVLSLIESRFLR
ncbi:MAG: hypothetical protein HY921_00340 [Elusimicrobia bacterium]|nr:hypothetical protein [Elusimicrobiota bacterium]